MIRKIMGMLGHQSGRRGIRGLAGAVIAIFLLCGFAPFAHGAVDSLKIGAPLCYVVTPEDSGAEMPSPSDYRCHGRPRGYQAGTLWLHMPVQARSAGDDLALLVHLTRFDRLTIFSTYADGAVRTFGVARGDFGTHWRDGGQIVFRLPDRDVPVASLTMRFDRLASHDLLRARLMPGSEADREGTLVGPLIGGALTLLLLGTIYNLSLAHGVRRQFIAWHGAWAACVFIWGLIWSQLALLVVPGIAGTLSSQICTFLSTLAIACATASAVTSLERSLLPRALRIGVLLLGAAVALVGLPAAFAVGPAIEPIGQILGVLIIADLLAVTAAIVTAWRRGSVEARDFALAWAVPMATLAATQLWDLNDRLLGGGAQIAVLMASAFQTIWLSFAITRRLARLRIERDAAQAAQAELDELARRDSLTGLLNRRGFIAAAGEALALAERENIAFGLLLIDVDRFKAVNDHFGHDVGDRVLRRIADRLRQWEGDICTAGRLGGEEFVLIVRGLAGRPLAEFADRVRIGIAGQGYDGLLPADMPVTVSIGLADTGAATSFPLLYRLADEALYEAKRGGRNRVVIHASGRTALPPRPARRA